MLEAASLSYWLPRRTPDVRPKLRELFKQAECVYPPREVSLVAIKDARRLEVWAHDSDPRWRLITTYPILGASGTSGPKLREGDGQVPEGIYRLTVLNPQSSYHLSIRVDYPNAFDCAVAAREGRTNLGGDIHLHGGSSSIGCLAMGDAAIEELYALVSDTGLPRSWITIAPTDLRTQAAPPGELYAMIREDLRRKCIPR
jgi:murein L,D-transpeptidase YafK